MKEILEKAIKARTHLNQYNDRVLTSISVERLLNGGF